MLNQSALIISQIPDKDCFRDEPKAQFELMRLKTCFLEVFKKSLLLSMGVPQKYSLCPLVLNKEGSAWPQLDPFKYPFCLSSWV
jgi:hypothetical protein